MRFTTILCTTIILLGVIQTDALGKKRQERSARYQSPAKHRELVARGRALFVSYQCLDCHKLAGKGCIDGIELDGVGDRRSESFLIQQLKDPEKHVDKVRPGDASLMTPQELNPLELKAVVAYLKTLKSTSTKDSQKN